MKCFDVAWNKRAQVQVPVSLNERVTANLTHLNGLTGVGEYKYWTCFSFCNIFTQFKLQNILLNWELSMSIFLIDIIHNFRNIWNFLVNFFSFKQITEFSNNPPFSNFFKHIQSSYSHSCFQVETPFKLWNIPQFVYIQGCIHLTNPIQTFENIQLSLKLCHIPTITVVNE